MAFNTIVREQDFYASSFAEYGFRVVDNSFSQPAGESYRAITIAQDASVTVVSASGDSFTTKVLPAGLTVYGKFTSVSVVSGLVIAYIGG